MRSDRVPQVFVEVSSGAWNQCTSSHQVARHRLARGLGRGGHCAREHAGRGSQEAPSTKAWCCYQTRRTRRQRERGVRIGAWTVQQQRSNSDEAVVQELARCTWTLTDDILILS